MNALSFNIDRIMNKNCVHCKNDDILYKELNEIATSGC